MRHYRPDRSGRSHWAAHSPRKSNVRMDLRFLRRSAAPSDGPINHIVAMPTVVNAPKTIAYVRP